MTDVELLRTMRDLLCNRQRWIQKSYGRYDGPYCLAGASFAAAGRQDFFDPPPTPSYSVLTCNSALFRTRFERQELTSRVARLLGFTTPREVFSFNDAHTYEDVLARLDDAIARAEEHADAEQEHDDLLRAEGELALA